MACRSSYADRLFLPKQLPDLIPHIDTKGSRMPRNILARILDIGQPKIIAKPERPPTGQLVAKQEIQPGIKALEPAIVLPKAAAPAGAPADAIGEIGTQPGLDLAWPGREMVYRIHRDLEIVEVDLQVPARSRKFGSLPDIFQPGPDPQAGDIVRVGFWRAWLLRKGFGAVSAHGHAKDIPLLPHDQILFRLAVIGKFRSTILPDFDRVERAFQRQRVAPNSTAAGFYGTGRKEEGSAQQG